MNQYTIRYTREAKNRIKKLDPSIKRIIKNAVESLTSNPFRGKPLSHELSGLYSLRTTDYRIIYRIQERELLILVITVGHRRIIYKRLRGMLDKEEG